MNVITITPPVVQFNTPYPSGAYLTSFFKSEGLDARWYDLNLHFFYSVFSSCGLSRLFELSQARALELADQAEKNGDEATAFNLRRYISQKDSWIEWIDFITAMLCDGGETGEEKPRITGREKAHQFLYSPFAPRGSRMENYLAGLDREPTVDDVRFLATFALADLSDYITVAFDPHFSLVRYAEALAVDSRSFSDFEKLIDSPVMEHFYKPVLEKLFLQEKFDSAKSALICISIPFAGTFLPALYTARFFKQHFGASAFISIGGGFVNTELREASESALAKYIDSISYDRGYGSYKALFEASDFLTKKEGDFPETPLYKMRLFKKTADAVKVVEPLWSDPKSEKYENEKTVKIIPDYSDIDFSIYPRMCDDRNAMHRIWSDGSWIKAYLAHGCYWRKCAFCDTTLDYVCGYKPTDIEPLYQGLLKTAREKGVYGIHFVDEALPPVALKKFALLNARAGNPLYFWGNVRFEKSFTRELAAFLSYCGLGGVSAGIESATGTGLEAINKGTDITSITHACCAFKEAGVLVHAYMIYGFWNDTAQSIIDSMETLRQFFAAGLLDSAFWHKFVLTRNSTVYSQWEKDGKLDLVSGEESSSAFARNNLHFKGEASYNKFGVPLDRALNSWMHGEGLEKKVQKWFDFPVPQPSVARDFIEKKIEEYEAKNQRRAASLSVETAKNLWWLGGKPVLCGPAANREYRWLYLMEEQTASEKMIDLELLLALRPEVEEAVRTAALNKIAAAPEIISHLKKLLGRGLVLLDF